MATIKPKYIKLGELVVGFLAPSMSQRTYLLFILKHGLTESNLTFEGSESECLEHFYSLVPQGIKFEVI